MSDWRDIAVDLAAALRTMPCTCVTKKTLWPFTADDHKDQVCRRCSSLENFDAAARERAA